MVVQALPRLYYREGYRRRIATASNSNSQILKMRKSFSEATANGPNSSKVHRRGGLLANVHIKQVKVILPRCKSAVLYFSCCGSFAALPALAYCNEYVVNT
jgi:hypothetical protein